MSETKRKLWIWGAKDPEPADLKRSGILSRMPVLQLEELNVQHFAIGKTCGAIISDDEICYQIGNPGETDLSLSSIESTLCEVSILKSHQVTAVACGYDHISVLVESGGVYCWGVSNLGQCGVVTDIVTEPRLVKLSGKQSNEQFMSISCGKHHTMAISRKHELWGWGLSHILGSSSSTRKNIACPKPEIVERLCGRRVLQVSCGKTHTAVITEKITKTENSSFAPDKSEICSLCKQEIYKMQDKDDHVIITDSHVCTHNSHDVDEDLQTSSAPSTLHKLKGHNRSASLPFFRNSPFLAKPDRLSKTPPNYSTLSNALKINVSSESLTSTKSDTVVLTENQNIEMDYFGNKKSPRKNAEDKIKEHPQKKTINTEHSKSPQLKLIIPIKNLNLATPPKSRSIPSDLNKIDSKGILNFPYKTSSDASLPSYRPGSKSPSLTSLDDCKSRMTLPTSSEDLNIDSESAIEFLKQLSPGAVEADEQKHPVLHELPEKSPKLPNESKSDTNKERRTSQSISEKLTQSITENKLFSPISSYSKNVFTGVMDGIEWIKTSTYDKGVAPIRELWSKESGTEISTSSSDCLIDALHDPLRTASEEIVNGTEENNKESNGILTLHTEVWTWGENKNGELGHADRLDRFQPTCVKTLSQRGIVKISSGSHHTVALTSNSEAFLWGLNTSGQLGHNNADNRSPQKVDCKNRIWDIAAGRQHTLFLVDDISQEPNILICGKNSSKLINTSDPLQTNGVSSSDNQVPRPVDFCHEMGFQFKVTAGFSCLSSCQAEMNSSSSTQLLHSFAKSEREFYQQITAIKAELLRPLKYSDLYKRLENSTYGEILSKVLELFGVLSYEIGLNTVSLTKAISSGIKCQENSFGYCGNNLITLYEKYFQALNDMIAYGFFEKCETLSSKGSKFLLLTKSIQIFKELLGDKRFSKLPSENFLQILQLPAFRLREYTKVFRKLSVILEEDLHLSADMKELSSKWDALWTKINNQLHSANSTRGFWKNEFKAGGGKLAESLKKVGRYLLIHSKKVPLDVAYSGRFSMNWFILFNDCLVLVHYGTFLLYNLDILWCTAIPDAKNKIRLLKITTPEEEIIASAGTDESKSSWINSFNRAINKLISNNETSNEINQDASQHHRAPPVSRHASYTFTKDADLKGASYSGGWYNGKPQGKGVMTWPDGRKYMGNYKNGKEDGYGEWKASSADTSKLKYKGWWKEGKMNGYGKLWFNKFQSYDGCFVDGVREGHGVLRAGSVTEGSVYVGSWKKDQKNGFGIEDNITKAEKYLGIWTNDQRHGVGILVTLDGVYCQSRFAFGETNGDTLVIEGRYTFEGHIAAGMMLNGKGRLTLPAGDRIEGNFSGPWSENIRVSGNFFRDNYHSSSTSSRSQSPRHFNDTSSGSMNSPHSNQTENTLRKYNRHILKKYTESKRAFPLCLHPDMKWSEIFYHCRKSLGCPLKDDEQEPDTRKIWEAVSVAMSNAKQRREQLNLSPQKKASERSMNWLERVPSVVTNNNYSSKRDQILTLEDINTIKEYLAQAFSTTLHPLGELVESLGNVYRDSYSGAGAHKWLLTQATADVHSFVRRSYDILRYLFPQLEKEHGVSHMKIINIDADTQSTDVVSDHTLGEVTAGDLLLPVLLPRVYPTLFTLYALRHEDEDRSYWERVTRLNRHPDVALLSFLGVKPKFWLLDEKEIPPLESSPEDGELYESVEQAESSKWRHLLVARARDCSFLNAIETLQLISTTFIPAEKLNVIHSTFKEINATVLKHHKQTHAWSMDDLFPVFQYVVVRSRISHLGCEIQLVEDFLESDMCKGEKGIMFTTLKACYFQIRVEKDL